jgi:hypothetical protein
MSGWIPLVSLVFAFLRLSRVDSTELASSLFELDNVSHRRIQLPILPLVRLLV